MPLLLPSGVTLVSGTKHLENTNAAICGNTFDRMTCSPRKKHMEQHERTMPPWALQIGGFSIRFSTTLIKWYPLPPNHHFQGFDGHNPPFTVYGLCTSISSWGGGLGVVALKTTSRKHVEARNVERIGSCDAFGQMPIGVSGREMNAKAPKQLDRLPGRTLHSNFSTRMFPTMPDLHILCFLNKVKILCSKNPLPHLSPQHLDRKSLAPFLCLEMYDPHTVTPFRLCAERYRACPTIIGGN